MILKILLLVVYLFLIIRTALYLLSPVISEKSWEVRKGLAAMFLLASMIVIFVIVALYLTLDRVADERNILLKEKIGYRYEFVTQDSLFKKVTIK